MKPYGMYRYDTVQCAYGCCTTKFGKHKDAREQNDRSRRKTARQTGKQQIFTQLLEEKA